MKSLIILGRQPALGIAELESLYGPDKVRFAGNQAAEVDVDPCLLTFSRLGGAVKFGKILTILDTTNWEQISDFLIKSGPEHSKSMPKGKMLLGISSYGHKTSNRQVQALAIEIKKAVKNTGRSVRVIPNNEPTLSSAQVFHGRLTSPNGWELLLVKDGSRTIIAQTVKVQNISAYSKRDQARPRRDTKVGMLPPKLAQIIINLSVGKLPPESIQSICEVPPDQPIPQTHFSDSLILDPFCGSGVIIQEAAIMGYDCTGTDLDERMVDFAKENLEWLSKASNKPISSKVRISLYQADARIYKWEQKPTFIASEAYLGPPLSNIRSQKDLKTTINNVNKIILEFLKNIGPQLQTGTRICLAVPAWQIKPGQFVHLPLLDSIGVIGYNRVSFKNVRSKDLIYYRQNQAVARELLVITKAKD